MSCPSGSEGAGRKRILARGQRAALPPYATLLLNSGASVLAVQTILGHKQVDTTLEYARLYDGTVAADYYSAMNHVERQISVAGRSAKIVPSLGGINRAHRCSPPGHAQSRAIRARENSTRWVITTGRKGNGYYVI